MDALHLRYYKNILADDGENGSKNNCTGRDGKDIHYRSSAGYHRHY